MAQPLSAETVAMVKSSASVLALHGVPIARRLRAAFEQDPALAPVFARISPRLPDLPERLAAAFVAYARNVDRMDSFSAVIEPMAVRHAEVGVQPDHFAPVAKALFKAMREEMGDEADHLLDAWSEAYWHLADLLIEAQARHMEAEAS